LLTLSFTVLAAGSIDINVDQVLFSDPFAMPLAYNLQGATITGVPVSSALSLMAFGLLALGKQRGRQNLPH
jgi:hypothetical protein